MSTQVNWSESLDGTAHIGEVDGERVYVVLAGTELTGYEYSAFVFRLDASEGVVAETVEAAKDIAEMQMTVPAHLLIEQGLLL